MYFWGSVVGETVVLGKMKMCLGTCKGVGAKICLMGQKKTQIIEWL